MRTLVLVGRLSVLNDGVLSCQVEQESVLGSPEVRECYWGKQADAKG